MSIIGLETENCKNCYKCVRACPVKSIKVADEQARIIERDCILCGKCYFECPQNAKTLSSDLDKVRGFLAEGAKVIVSLAPSYFSGFPFEAEEQLVGALKSLGVWGVAQTADGAAYVSAQYAALMQEGKMKNIITTCCPTVNDLAEKYYPTLVPFLAPVISPMVAHGKLLKAQYGENCKVVFAGPCIAKKGEAQDIRHDTVIDAVLTFDDVNRWLLEEKVDIAACKEEAFLQGDAEILRMYPITGGIRKTVEAYGSDYPYDMVSVDGMDNIKELFSDMEKGAVEGCFIEINACPGGCINGPAKGETYDNRFQAKLKLQKHVRKTGSGYPELHEDVAMHKQFLNRTSVKDIPDEETIREILKKIGKDKPEQELNCGSCGYPSCRDKAVAVYQGKAELNMCMPYMKAQAESLSNFVLAETPNITLLVNEDLDIIEFNKAAEKAFDLSRAEALTKGLYELIDTADFQFVLESKQSIIDKKVTYEAYNMTALLNVIYIEQGNIVMGILKDITEEERSKEALYQLRVDTVDMAQKVIDKQMIVAQEIASLLGETTAETKVTLTKLKNMIVYDGDEE